MFQPEPLEKLTQDIRDRSEYLEGWDEEVTKWIRSRESGVCYE